MTPLTSMEPLRSAVGGRRSFPLHFARAKPIVGTSLRRARVALIGLPVATPIVTHLAACGVGRWVLWVDPEDGSVTTLQTYLLDQHGPALALDMEALPPGEWADAVRRNPPDLVIAVGGAAEKQGALEAATAVPIPALLITPPTLTHPCQTISLFPGDDPTGVAGPLYLPSLSLSPWDWITSAPLCAGLARATLLRDTRYRRADLEDLWAAGMRVLTLGDGANPFAVRRAPLVQPGENKLPIICSKASKQQVTDSLHRVLALPFLTPAARRGNLLIVGLGSLGSVAAMYLAPHTAGMVIADPDHVDAYNPVRQAYPLATVGRPKAQALRDELIKAGAENAACAPPAGVVALETALTDEDEVAALIARYGVTAALVVTGTPADFAIARALRAGDVPHVVGRCYPRARYWEAILVDGRRGPALSDLRGHLRLGPAPSPTPEQIAAYSDAGALEAEPATLIESGWAAAWMARLTAQLLAPPGLRERWMLDLLASERTCLIGGVGVEPTADGPAYGVALPGAIRAWGRAEINRQSLHS